MLLTPMFASYKSLHLERPQSTLMLLPGKYILTNNKTLFCFSPQLLCLVGEAFDNYSEDVCGAVINVRAKGDKIAIWTTNYENREAVTHIG